MIKIVLGMKRKCRGATGRPRKAISWAKENNLVFVGSKFLLIRYGSDEFLKNGTRYLTDPV